MKGDHIVSFGYSILYFYRTEWYICKWYRTQFDCYDTKYRLLDHKSGPVRMPFHFSGTAAPIFFDGGIMQFNHIPTGSRIGGNNLEKLDWIPCHEYSRQENEIDIITAV